MPDDASTAATGPDLDLARQRALMAHEVVIKLKEMDLPEGLDRELASLSTDLGDLWGAQADLADGLESFLKSPQDWESVGAALVDLRVVIDHITWRRSEASMSSSTAMASFGWRYGPESAASSAVLA